MNGIFRPRQAAVQRLTPNAGNRSVIAGGKGPNRLVSTVVPHRLARALVVAVLVTGGAGPVNPPQDDKGAPDEL